LPLPLLPLVRWQADVERHRLATTNLDFFREPLVAILEDLNAVQSLSHLDQQALLVHRTVPVIAVDQNLCCGRLDANDEGAEVGRRGRLGGCGGGDSGNGRGGGPGGPCAGAAFPGGVGGSLTPPGASFSIE